MEKFYTQHRNMEETKWDKFIQGDLIFRIMMGLMICVGIIWAYLTIDGLSKFIAILML